MMTDRNSAVLEVSVEEKGVTPMPQTLLNDASTVYIFYTIFNQYTSYTIL